MVAFRFEAEVGPFFTLTSLGLALAMYEFPTAFDTSRLVEDHVMAKLNWKNTIPHVIFSTCMIPNGI